MVIIMRQMKAVIFSWYDFANEIFRQAGYETEVIPVTTAEYGQSKAARPFNSRLDKGKLKKAGFTPLPDCGMRFRGICVKYRNSKRGMKNGTDKSNKSPN